VTATFLRQLVPLAPLTTLGVGGPARFFAEAQHDEQVLEALEWAHQRGVPVEVIGGGSNLLVADGGFDGLVLRVGMMGIGTANPIDEDGTVRVRVGGGHGWDTFVQVAVEAGWAGVECLSGIPGAVGASPIQNIGAYGQDVSDTISSVRVVERSTGAEKTLPASACAFAYRDSLFKNAARGRYVVVSVDFDLVGGGAPSIRYPELSRELQAQGGKDPPTLPRVRRTVLELRRRKSMVMSPHSANCRSAGSFFTNPIVTKDVLGFVCEKVGGANVPAFDAGAGQVKLSAGWLIERAGFARGTRHGNVGTSSAHTLALVNHGGATALEISSFALRIRDAVRSHFGVVLVPEPAWVGFSDEELSAWRA